MFYELYTSTFIRLKKTHNLEVFLFWLVSVYTSSPPNQMPWFFYDLIWKWHTNLAILLIFFSHLFWNPNVVILKTCSSGQWPKG